MRNGSGFAQGDCFLLCVRPPCSPLSPPFPLSSSLLPPTPLALTPLTLTITHTSHSQVVLLRALVKVWLRASGMVLTVFALLTCFATVAFKIRCLCPSQVRGSSAPTLHSSSTNRILSPPSLRSSISSRYASKLLAFFAYCSRFSISCPRLTIQVVLPVTWERVYAGRPAHPLPLHSLPCGDQAFLSS